MFKIMRPLRSLECLKTTVELTFTTQKVNTCSPWTACSVFDWKYLFGQICWSKLKFRIRLIWICRIVQKICGVHFFCFRLEKAFWGKSGKKKNQNFQFKLKFGTKTNLNMRNSMMMFTFSVFDHKCLSWAKWNLIQRLIPICKIQWWCLFYLFLTENSYSFWANLIQKIETINLSWKLVHRVIQIWRIR